VHKARPAASPVGLHQSTSLSLAPLLFAASDSPRGSGKGNSCNSKSDRTDKVFPLAVKHLLESVTPLTRNVGGLEISQQIHVGGMACIHNQGCVHSGLCSGEQGAGGVGGEQGELRVASGG